MKNNLCLIFPLLFLLVACDERQTNDNEKATTAIIEIEKSESEANDKGSKGLRIGYPVVIEEKKTTLDGSLDGRAISLKEQQKNTHNFHQEFVNEIQVASENSHDPEAMQALSEKLANNTEQYKQEMLSLGKALMKQESNHND